ncbi:MAG TPA: peptidase M48, partial [Micromonosporaceae bacterium]|nr:peptidase M48 [Micromonosporaceae bacterium]
MPWVSLTSTPELCPSCQVSLVTDADETPWCERCEWNLDFVNPDPHRGRVGRMLDRWAFRVGFTSNRRLFKEISSRPIRRPEITPAFLLLLGVSLLLMGIFVSAIVSGLFLVIDGNPGLKLVGLFLLGFAFVFRPRIGRLKPYYEHYDEVTRGTAPHLFALLDRSADAIGARRPDHVFVSPEWNASADVVGLRRRKVLLLGLPLWVSSRPQERVFILGHELGHFVNRDVRRGLLTQPACTMFANLADMVRPDTGRVSLEDDLGFGLLTKLANMIARPFLWALSYALLIVHIGMTMIAATDGQRAEYYADTLAMELAGTKASTCLDLLNESFLTVVGARARGNHGFEDWRIAVEQARVGQMERLARLRQVSLRKEASPFHEHPPYGLRHR